MDPLSWLLFSWIAVCGIVFFIVQNVLPIFIPPPKHLVDSASASATPPAVYGQSHKEEKKIELRQQQQSPESQSAFQSWAASAMGMVKGVGKSQQGESCEWVNNLLLWLNRNIRKSPDIINAWLRAMNEASNKLAVTLGCDVYFEEVTVADGQSERKDQDAPKVSAIRSEFGPREHLTLRTNLVYPKLNLRLVASQKLPDRLIVSNYVASLRDLKGEAQVRMACVQNELFLMVSFDGKPDVVVSLENGDKQASERVDPALVDEIIKRCLATATTNICLGKPQQANGHVAGGGGAVPLMSGEEIRNSQATSMQERVRSRRLLLKVQRAEKLGGGGDFPSQPYVVVELDEPAQKHETTLSLNAHPIWEEQFLFDLNERSEEILFEVYDRKTDYGGKITEPRFLGLAIVGIEELRQSSNLSHTLALQSRPYKNDTVSGTLEVEFIFLRDTRGGSKRSVDDSPLVKSVSQCYLIDQYLQFVDGNADNQDVVKRTKNSLAPQAVDLAAKTLQTLPTPIGDRSRKRERSFFGDLKRRLSFRRNRDKRAQSVEADIDGRRGQNSLQIQQPRSVSTPPSRDASATRRPDHTPVASDSEMSVTSNDSVFPQSQLIVEVSDNGLKKYYLIPTPVQRHAIGKKIIKSGKKLHVYNSHTFTAIKSPPGVACAVCSRVVASGFRRKGYQCRDCGFICHKRCHFKTQSHCPCDKITNLPIEVVKLN